MGAIGEKKPHQLITATLIGLQLSQNNIRRLLRNHISRNRGEGTRNPGVDRSINNTEAIDTTDPELRVQNSHRVIISANRASARSMVAPGGILDISLDLLLGLQIRAGEDFINVNSLAAESVTGKLDRLVESLEVGFVIANAGVEVIEDDIRDVERIRRTQGNLTRCVAGVSFENSPAEPVVLFSDVETVIREVAAEVDGAAEDEDVVTIIGGSGALEEHGSR